MFIRTGLFCSYRSPTHEPKHNSQRNPSMGQGSSRSNGQPAPALSTPNIDPERIDNDTSVTSEGATQRAASAPSSGKVHSARLPRNHTDVRDTHAPQTQSVSDDTHLYNASIKERHLATESPINQLFALDASAGHMSTPPPHSTCPTPTSDYIPVASSSSLPSLQTPPYSIYNTSQSASTSLDNHGNEKTIEMRDASGSNSPTSTASNVQQVRSRRQTLADKLRNARRRSFRRLSWGFSGGYGASESTTPEASSSIADVAEGKQDTTEGGQHVPIAETKDAEMATDIACEVSTPQESESRDPWRIMTPPPDEDVMFEERQRARRLVEDALAQLQSELARPNSPYASANSTAAATNLTNQSVQGHLQDPSLALSTPTHDNLESISSNAIASTGLNSAAGVQVDGATQLPTSESAVQASPPARLFAPLPRRSASRSPTPPDNSTSGSGLLPSTLGSFLSDTTPRPVPTVQPSSPSTAREINPEAMSDLMVPRRILVQGIVSSSPPPSSTLASRPPVASSSRSSVHGERNRGSLWDELPGTEAMAPPPWRRASNSEDAFTRSPPTPGEDDDDEAWENAVSAALGQRSRARGPLNQRAADHPARVLQDQANLIGRLLSVAAAATAATLIPGITVNGAPVTGFGDSQGSDLLGGAGIPLGAAQSPPRALSPAPTPRPRSDSLGTFRTPGRNPYSLSDPTNTAASALSGASASPSSPPSAALQDILRNALAAAFRSATSSTPANETNSTDQTPSAFDQFLPSSANARNSSNTAGNTTPTQSTSPPTSPPLLSTGASATRSSPDRRLSDPFGQGTALAIPVTSLHSDVPYVSGTHHLPGSFERFLSDLQADVSAAILRSRESSSTSATPSANPQATGLEEMRPLLDDIDEVASDADSRPPAVSTASQETGAPSEAAPQTAPGRQAFSFFRSYRFSPVPLPGAGATGGTEAPDVTTSPTQAISESRSSVAPEDVVMDGAEITTSTAVPLATSSTPVQAQQPSFTEHSQPIATTPAIDAPATLLPSRHVVPMLLVGVRSASLIGFNDSESTATRASSDTAMSGTSSNMPHIQRDTPAESESTAQATAGSLRANSGRETGGFVLWILGGLYPANHPIVIAPSLLGDDAMSYDELLRLAEVLGNVKPPTVTSEEITKSDLKVVKSNTLAELHTNGDIREITLERCLVCLEDYEDEEDVRILNCRHCFHQACVDTWLSTGANTCPACRTIGVPKDASPPLAEALQPAAA